MVPLLMGWFAGRFNTERFVIYDEVHQVAGIHDAVQLYIAQTDECICRSIPMKRPQWLHVESCFTML